MPHFYSQTPIKSESIPLINGDFEFVLRAKKSFNNTGLILVRYKKQEFFIVEDSRKNKVLYKCLKSSMPSPMAIAKDALRILMQETDCVVSHNLSAKASSSENLVSGFLLSPLQLQEFLQTPKGNLSLEIGFGSARHLLELAKSNPQEQFLGIEVYNPAISQALRHIKLLNLKNLFVCKFDARTIIEIIPNHSLKAIYIHFPIPWNKKPHRRIFQQDFLSQALCKLQKTTYKISSLQIPKSSFLHLRTDDREYFDDVLKLTWNLKQTECMVRKNMGIHTVSKYEARWLKQHKDIYDMYLFANTSKDTCVELDFKTQKLEFYFCDKDLQIAWQRLKNLTKNPQNLPKIIKKDYFLHINGIYEDRDCFLLSLCFGDFYQAQNTFILAYRHSLRYIGEMLVIQSTLRMHELLCRYLKGKDIF
ncbi:tRNA (guanosine(46)-N7)-methyltransferase TrmB [Helicobacter sp. 10-6591]|uniref:tRNA (guanosine(46)-N7)-methyltransferase TrmB n=1 Tax=Helicobacter sp. 10-6591 TaxID=2004998 RepID=UPI000DCF03DF|nr:tRNA (guanosine(46)-N7)-methyltransferase TrmB [Helicobacter sp. 10-6591]RAX54596.1 tRNA (guanosine(46)-N7)-methyltransferase TrmB [Helicobacter sp. 10-6591]